MDYSEVIIDAGSSLLADLGAVLGAVAPIGVVVIALYMAVRLALKALAMLNDPRAGL